MAQLTVNAQRGKPPQKAAARARAPAASGLLQRKCECGNGTLAGGECEECGRKRLPRKLSISESNDPLELEADRIAGQAMAAPLDAPLSMVAAPVARRSATHLAGTRISASASVDRALADAGLPLESHLQEDMEMRFGYDFSHVRVHSDPVAEQSARDLDAQAYTAGHHIVFGAGRFTPGSQDGRALLAHELAHVIQQTAPSSRTSGPGITSIQRKLIIEGRPKPADVSALFKILEPHSGFRLKFDHKTGEVTIDSADPKPASPALADRLKDIIEDLNQDAVLSLGRGQAEVGFGEFPGQARPGATIGELMQDLHSRAQIINLDDFEVVEKGSPGSGAALLIHEIVENYSAFSPGLGKYVAEQIFPTVHELALAVEANVSGELVGKGRRVASMARRGPWGDVMEADDYENYYLLHDKKHALTVGKIKVATFTITGFAKNSPLAVPTNTSTLESIRMTIDAMDANPFSTVRIEGVAAREATMQEIAREIIDQGRARGATDFDVRNRSTLGNFNIVTTDTSFFADQVVITVSTPDLRGVGPRTGVGGVGAGVKP